jgi:hypothetical protein
MIAQLPLGVALSVLCSQALPKCKKRLAQRMLFQLKKPQRLRFLSCGYIKAHTLVLFLF